MLAGGRTYLVGEGVILVGEQQDAIDQVHSTVQYSSFDNAVSIVQRLWINALCGKCDVKSAFRLLPAIYQGCFDLLEV